MVFSLSKWRRRSLAKDVKGVAEKQTNNTSDFQQRRNNDATVPESQLALLLHEIRTPYELVAEYALPSVQHDHELLVKVTAVGLNPIDWKAPDFNFGIPVLPYISGRELVGTVIRAPSTPNSRIRTGDIVIVPSTDYRDLRKAAFQQYSIASAFNTIRLPVKVSEESGSILGVALVAATLALGICMGVDFSDVENGPDLLKIVESIDAERLPADIRKECLEGIKPDERAKKGDFLVIWGGSSTCAHIAKQLARLAGLKIISVVDTGKHGLRLSSHASIRPDLVVDSHDPERAVSVIKAATGDAARFGFDTQGKDTAAHLLRSLASKSTNPPSFPETEEPYTTDTPKTKLPTPPSTPLETSATPKSHLVGLTGLPKSDIPEDVALHSVPIKLFHEIPEVGEAICAWAEKLLVTGALVTPDVVGVVDGLGGINGGLEKLRRREVSGGRLVAVLK
ncbi:GroES-like protein [Massarina eburnea CBS 473.64]|uniref:GroES-like protein n=1 Tax=Massarina eburnea CBS 473.64 TaxID=1395130 RepID=A0A6A6S3C0_9PLEO|nr:GroES-like protein [Massarina eburnea CBS 473.64]